uniref:GPN-loop GTPase 3 n=1 Tax=Globodera pallida TaxID=36090 RepID=A0A183C0F0_GLOPA
MKYAQLVVGPAGSGKSTYCAAVQLHCKTIGRTVFVVNLDPAAEQFNYDCAVDVRDLVSVEDVLEEEELAMGPNGALVYCMEYLADNLEWLHGHLNEGEDDYFLFDCPGQIELYSHLPVMRQIVQALCAWNFSVCSIFVMDTTFCLDPTKFMSATLTALSTTVSMQTPAVNVLSKMDLLSVEDRKTVGEIVDGELQNAIGKEGRGQWEERHRKLTEAIATVIDDYSMIRFIPLDIEDEGSIEGRRQCDTIR